MKKKKNEKGKDKDVKRNKQEKEGKALVGQCFGGWLTFWLAGREARLVWGSVVSAQT